jgi:hypothetical protein
MKLKDGAMLFNSYTGEVFNQNVIGRLHGGLITMTKDSYPIYAGGIYVGCCINGQLIKRKKRGKIIMYFDPKTGQIVEETSLHATGIALTEEVTPLYFHGRYMGYFNGTKAVLRT